MIQVARVEAIRPQVRRHIGLAVAGAAAMLGSVSTMLPMPLITRHIIDEVLPRGASAFATFDGIIAACFAIVGLRTALEYAQSYAFARFRQEVVRDTKAHLLAHVLRLPSEELARFKSGYLVGRIQRDCDRLGGIMGATVFGLLRDALTFGVGAFMVVRLHPGLGWTALALVLPYVLATHGCAGVLSRTARGVQETDAVERGAMQELVAGAHTIKAYLADLFAARRAGIVMDRAIEAQRRSATASCNAGALVGLIGACAPLILFWGCGREIMAERMSIGTWLAFQAFLGYLFGPASAIAGTLVTAQGSLVALDRIGEILALAVEPRAPRPRTTEQHRAAGLSVRNLSYTYPEGTPALSGCSFDLRAGEHVALVGPSGCGKSTLADLLVRLRDPSTGSVTLDGRNIAHLAVEELRSAIVVAFQTGVFFSGPLRDNVCLGTTPGGDEWISKGLRSAQAMSIVQGRPGGLNGEIDEGARDLSGGQRQRLALARALIQGGSLLVLDEPTANLDARTARELIESIRSIEPRPSLLVITHSLALASQADRIVVMEQGRVVGAGRHRDLASSCPLYRELWLSKREHSDFAGV